MANFIQKFENQSAYDAAEHQYPNVSLVGTDIVYKMEAESNGIITKYDVTSTSEATTLLKVNRGISYQIIDGVKQDTVQTTYTFDTLGEHIVEYKLDGTSIGDSVFQGCTGLKSVTIPDGVTSIDFQAFSGCSGLTSVTIPSSVTSIGQNAFRTCTSLTNITIPDSVTSIGGSAFSGCSGLTSINIPSGVTSISVFAFSGCSSLTSITIPNSVTSIGNNAFDGSNGLTSITCLATTPPTLSDTNAFDNTNNCPIYVPVESVETFKTTGNWVSLASRIQAIPTI